MIVLVHNCYFQTDIVDVVQQLEANEKRRQQVTEEIVSHPSPRSNFSFITHPEKDELIVFGGEFFNGKTLTVYNELFFYNIDKQQWKKVMAPGGPGPRCSHQMVGLSNDGGQLWVSSEIDRSMTCIIYQTLTYFGYRFSAESIQHHPDCSSITTKTCGRTISPRRHGQKLTFLVDRRRAVVIV